MSEIQAKLGLIQRVLPNYRVPFFNALGSACSNGLSVFAGDPMSKEAIETENLLENAELVKAGNRHFFQGSMYLCWQQGLKEWLQDFQPDVLIVEANPRYLSTFSAIRWMQQRHRPKIGWGLGAPDSSERLKGIRCSARYAFLNQFEALITYSQKGYEEYSQLGFARDRIIIAPNAVTPRPSKRPLDRPNQFNEGRATILSVGRLQARKRLDLLIRACASFPYELRPRLWIVGEGPVRAELEELAREIFPETRFFGALFGEELDPVYNEADLFVLPGTGGLAVQQAMAHGLPVIVAEADGTQTDLVRSQNGFLTLPGDVEQLQFTIKLALDDPVKLRKMGLASYQIVAEEINLENMVQSFTRAVDLVLKEPS